MGQIYVVISDGPSLRRDRQWAKSTSCAAMGQVYVVDPSGPSLRLSGVVMGQIYAVNRNGPSLRRELE